MITVEEIRDHLPRYLTAGQQAELVRQLRDFENRNYYTSLFGDELLQGDGWSGVEILNFTDGNRDKIRGILLSNSCDISSSNPRDFPPKIVFAPLVRFDDLARALQNVPGLQPEKFDSKIIAIRQQRVSSLFFLPQGNGLEVDHVAILDDLHSIPLAAFSREAKKTKLFTLGQMGFYLFLMKLSFHFCRFQEGITRS
jgi:hypothetical protein